jgi:hypothetical protein
MGAALTVVPAVVAASAQPTEITLRVKRDQGETLRYRAEVSGSGAITVVGDTQTVAVSGRFRRVERVLSAVKPGVWQVRVTIEEPSLTFRAGKDAETLKMQVPPLTEVVTDRGQVLEMRGWEVGQAPVDAPGMGDAVRPVFGLVQEQGLPEAPVKVGEAWTATAKLKMPEGADVTVPQRFELLGYQDIGGQSCAKVRATADVPIRRELPSKGVGAQVRMEGTEHIETMSFLAYEQAKLVRQVTAINLDLKTSTLIDPAAPDRVLPGSISLRVNVIMTLEP